MNGNHFALQISEAIAPYVGAMMARSSIELHCKRLGYDPARLELSQLEGLLQQISLGLNVFIGRDKTETVIRQIRASLMGAQS